VYLALNSEDLGTGGGALKRKDKGGEVRERDTRGKKENRGTVSGLHTKKINFPPGNLCSSKSTPYSF